MNQTPRNLCNGILTIFNPNNYSDYDELSKKISIWNLFEPGLIMKTFLLHQQLTINQLMKPQLLILKMVRKIGGHTIRDVNPKGKLDAEGIDFQATLVNFKNN